MTLDFRPARMEDAEQIYRFVQAMPAEENGFVNEQYGIPREQFMSETLPAMIAWSRGEQLKEGYVPETDCFLYVDGEAAGMFKLRHHLNAFLENGPGTSATVCCRSTAARALPPRDCAAPSPISIRCCPPMRRRSISP